MPAAPAPTRRVVVLHGYNADPGKHWFDWLAADLAPDGIAVSTPALPDSGHPDPEAWIEAARTAIGTPDDGLVVVGHSLGCITALNALARLGDTATDGASDSAATDTDTAATATATWRLAGLILVSGFDRPLRDLPDVDPFTARHVDYAPIIQNTGRRWMIVSDDDGIVPPADSHALAAELSADVIEIAGGGHFRQDDGYTSFSELASVVRGILA